ncbi:hypothetical protein AMATHDRAFT_6268 [Amanita thiersii Skay4041]|uniref:Uncharacterized protein n=1 Tax=Amanita thiersii Skay4041 TaxID=703135 RepID=A0A2A9NJW2_9AGAR|nr:hypothetical protein AMATHDRAFT_6268 [Amanita thiersii Skay4041]
MLITSNTVYKSDNDKREKKQTLYTVRDNDVSEANSLLAGIGANIGIRRLWSKARLIGTVLALLCEAPRSSAEAERRKYSSTDGGRAWYTRIRAPGFAFVDIILVRRGEASHPSAKISTDLTQIDKTTRRCRLVPHKIMPSVTITVYRLKAEVLPTVGHIRTILHDHTVKSTRRVVPVLQRNPEFSVAECCNSMVYAFGYTPGCWLSSSTSNATQIFGTPLLREGFFIRCNLFLFY